VDEFGVAVTNAILALAASPWVYPAVFILTVLDAFLVVLPSESVVAGFAALSMSTGSPPLITLAPIAALAAMTGDSLTYLVGRRVGTSRFAWMRRPTAVKALGWARTSLDRRPASVLLTARFIPFGRIAVNLSAGACGFRYRRFVALTAVGGALWAVYNTVLGAAFGAWLHNNPLLAVVLSTVIAVALGVAIDLVVSKVRARLQATDEGG
jgi:membrane protein DedA with SNARE-associated domain